VAFGVTGGGGGGGGDAALLPLFLRGWLSSCSDGGAPLLVAPLLEGAWRGNLLTC